MARVFDHTSAVCLDVEVNPKTQQTETKAVPEGSGPFPLDEYGSDELLMVELYRVFKERFDKMNKHFDRMTSLFNRQEEIF